jgi:hypothetical protein
MKRHCLRLGLVAAVLAAVAGCGASKVQVAGKLEWADGKAAVELADGQVIFESAETKTSARGVIGKDGTFRINTDGASDGVLPGTYQVAIVEHRPAPEGTTQMPPQHLPDKYYSFASSGLTATVTSGVNDIVLKLERMPGKK